MSVELTELVAGPWQLRPWPAAYADLDEVLAEQGWHGAELLAERHARLDGWRHGDLLGFAVREITTGRSVAEVLVRVRAGRASVTTTSRPGATVAGEAADVVRRWAAAALGLEVADEPHLDSPALTPGAAYRGAMSSDDPDLVARRATARRGCTRWLLGHGDLSPAAWLAEVAAAATEPDLDRYGTGGEVEALEREVAELLGKQAAVFMPSGVMAQQAALRSWADRAGTRAVAVHGLAHLVLHELDALPELHGLRLQR